MFGQESVLRVWHFIHMLGDWVHLAWEGVLGLAVVLAVVHVVTHRIGEERVETFDDRVIEALTGFPVYKAAKVTFEREHSKWQAGKPSRRRAWLVAQIGEEKMQAYEKLAQAASKAEHEAWESERAEAAAWVGNGIDGSQSDSWYAEAARCEKEMAAILQPVQGEFHDDIPEPLAPSAPALGRLEDNIRQAWFLAAIAGVAIAYFWWNPWHFPYGHRAGGAVGGWDVVIGIGVPVIALPTSYFASWLPTKASMWLTVKALAFVSWFMKRKNLQTASYVGALIELIRAVIEHI